MTIAISPDTAGGPGNILSISVTDIEASFSVAFSPHRTTVIARVCDIFLTMGSPVPFPRVGEMIQINWKYIISDLLPLGGELFLCGSGKDPLSHKATEMGCKTRASLNNSHSIQLTQIPSDPLLARGEVGLCLGAGSFNFPSIHKGD
jgi:hypothetical protein